MTNEQIISDVTRALKSAHLQEKFVLENDFETFNGKGRAILFCDGDVVLFEHVGAVRSLAGKTTRKAWGLEVSKHIPATREEPEDVDIAIVFKDTHFYSALIKTILHIIHENITNELRP